MINFEKYLNEKPDFISEFTDEAFGEIYNKHKHLEYLKDITEAMLSDVICSEKQWDNFKSWVYMYGDTLREKEESLILEKSNSLKEIIKNSVGKKIKIKIRGDGIFGNMVELENVYKVVENNKHEIFLMPPRSRVKGYPLRYITILELTN